MKLREKLRERDRNLTVRGRLSASNLIMFLIPVGVTFVMAVFSAAVAYLAFVKLYLPQLGIDKNQLHEMGEVYEDTLHSFFLFCFVLLMVMLLIIILSIILTNRFLTRFVFRRISEPLAILEEGVARVQAGDLESPIVYERKDEFTPVCEAVNLMTAKLRESAQSAQSDEQSRRELFVGISHDLRSPLTSVRAYTEALLDGVAKTPEDERRYLEIIHTRELDIERMAEQLFLFSKMEIKDFPLTLKRLDLRGELLRIVNENPMDHLAVDLVGVEPFPVRLDPSLFCRVILNLLENSRKYRVKENATVTVTAVSEAGKIRITLTDDGTGVAEDVLPKLFFAFYRTDPARKNPAGGSGLGLAIVKKAVERMGGEVSAANAPGGGLRVSILFPEVCDE